jgi:hypothetical protein
MGEMLLGSTPTFVRTGSGSAATPVCSSSFTRDPAGAS